MGKHRIYEIARDLATDSKHILTFLEENKIEVKSQLSSVDDKVRDLIVQKMSKKAAGSAPKAAAPVEKKPEHKPEHKPVTPAQPSVPQPTVAKTVVDDGQKKVVVQTGPQGQKQHKIILQRPANNNTAAPTNRPGYQGNNNRPGYQGNNNRTGYQGNNNRPGYQGNNNRPGYQGSNPNNNRPGYQGNNNRPGYQGSNPNNNRPGYQGNNNRPGYQGSNPNNNRPGYQGNNNRPGYQGNNNRPGYQGGNRPQTGANGGSGSYAGNKPYVKKDFGSAPKETTAVGAAFKENKHFQNNKHEKKGQTNYPSKERKQHMSDRLSKNPIKQPKQPKPVQEVVRPASVEVGETINVQEFAKLIKCDVTEIIKKLFLSGVMVNINQNIDFETAFSVADDFGVEVTEKAPEEDPTELPEVEDDVAKRLPRPPVVTVMGHVDHGKTSLLDAIRKTSVTTNEAGGITQHIGAYKVSCQGKPIVFLDTPGHEAFTAMRARGAQVTDIAVLVVAADDGVMPQTLEAINHAKAAKVPIVVAINKIDKEGANPDHVKQQLAEHELIPEEWGGDVIMVPVSAHQKTGISDLLETILLVAEVLELKANPDLPAHGTIIEAQLDKGRGPVATVLVERGTLRVGDTIIAGTAYGKVRAMINDRGEKVKKAGPATPVEVLGLSDVPMAGDILDATEERLARSIAEKRIAKKKTDELQQTTKVSLDDLFNRIQEGEIKELNIVVKADVQGTIQALEQSLTKIKNDEVKVVVVHASVGAINESDVMLASASNALIIGFNVRPSAVARKAAETEKVDIRTYRVIYDAINDVEAAIKGMLAPKFEEVISGHVEVRQVITISKMLIAGCYVLDGKITSSSQVRLIRDGVVLHEGPLESLRRFKDDVREVASGYECGITLENYRDLKVGDQFEVFTMEKVAVK